MKEVVIFVGMALIVLACLPWALKLLGLYADYGSWVLGK